MSFILDALKKSESDRLRQDAPSIASIPERSQAASSKKWIWVVAGLLTVNLVVLLGFVLWKNTTVTYVAVPVELSGQDTKATSFSEMVSEVKRNQPDLLTQTTPKPVMPPAQVESADVGDAEAAASGPRPGTIRDGLETFNDLRAKGDLQLPDMHLDIHVYAGAPADRFVFVNMSKYKEGAILSEGPQVKEIVPEGVVLEHRETTFLLPRQ